MPIARLDRTVISLAGEDVDGFVSGLITNSLKDDISFAALLTPQGKIIADFFVTKNGDTLLIDTPDKFVADLMKRLKMYKLRAKIDMVQTDLSVYAFWDGSGDEGYADPRHDDLGRRLITQSLETTAVPDDYNAHRLTLSIPDSTWDFETASVFPADANMDLINGVDFKKGCFVGQEVVSRMHRKTSVRKRMFGLMGPGSVLEDNTLWQDGRKVGLHLSHFGEAGMALLRADKLDAALPVTDGETNYNIRS